MLKIPTDIFSASVKKRHNKPLQTDERRTWFLDSSRSYCRAAQRERSADTLPAGFRSLRIGE